MTLASTLLGNVFASVDKADCTNIDIRDRHPELKSFLSTPRNQGSVGWCYGFAAADLLSVEIGKPVSSFHVSTSYNNSNYNNRIFNFMRSYFSGSHDSVYESGWIAHAVDVVVRKGKICSELTMPFNTKLNSNKIIDAIEAISRTVKKKNSPVNKIVELIKSKLPQESLIKVDLVKFAKSLKIDNPNVSLEKFVAAHCGQGLLPVPRLKSNIFMVSTHGETGFHEQLGGALKRGKPVAIHYDTQYYTKSGQSGAHISVITARRWKNNKCQYKIRNSWGQSCASYRNGVECIKSEGAFWVDATDLTDHGNVGYYLSPKRKIDVPWQPAL